MKIWEKLFSNQPIIDLCADECPMIIGITRRSLGENDSFLTSEYEFKVLLNGDSLIDTYETLFNQLDEFREEFYENEAELVSVYYLLNNICLINFLIVI